MPDAQQWGTARLLSTAARLVEQRWEEELRALGLTFPAVVALDALVAAGPVTQDELATIMRAQPQTLGPLLLRLELRGCINRRRRRTSRHNQTVSITATGTALLQEAHALERGILEGVTQDVDALRDELRAIISEAAQRPTSGGGLNER
ncbi:MarR family transcriptional regulator [Arthrobacter sp. efr-133-TYG-104]|uniref:MarR family transcriptional regulator n=1 Tax=Arthrobacter sp. efr-133-TYG-104 TaxID=3040324 RepID=UPI002551C21B|nr:MarR family transcriptional regulator [Arthrobacter sp. efr-133-TYG-104]